MTLTPTSLNSSDEFEHHIIALSEYGFEGLQFPYATLRRLCRNGQKF